MFSTNRESCMVNKTKMRGQMKTQKKNAPSVCQYWRRGRMSGNSFPPGCFFLTVLSVFNYAFRGVSMSVWIQTWDGRCSCFFATVSWDAFYFKNPKVYNQQKTPECLKITGLMEHLFGRRSGFLERIFLPSVGIKCRKWVISCLISNFFATTWVLCWILYHDLWFIQ